ncbi:MAG: MYXO-CTERM sorting domain-containing protein [Myxococcota bacterium]
MRAGDTVGFRFGGRNSDDDNFLRGSFSVFDEPLGPGLDSACIGKDSSGNVDGDEFCDDVDPCNGDQRVGFADGDSVCGAEELCFGRDATGDRDLDAICNDLDLCIGEDISGDTDDDNVCDDVDQCLGNDNAGDTDDDGVCNDIDVQLVSLQELEPGDDDCPTGGTAILIGSDDGGEGAEAGNQELEPSEIDQTVFACNGLDGQNQDGTSCAVESGDDGAVSITCEDGTFATVPSEDAGGSSSCSVSDDGDGTVRIVCPDGSEAEVESAGGCSTAPLDPSRSGFWLLATIGMLRLLRRRQTA